MKTKHHDEVSRLLHELLKKYSQDKETTIILDRIAAVALLSAIETPTQSASKKYHETGIDADLDGTITELTPEFARVQTKHGVALLDLNVVGDNLPHRLKIGDNIRIEDGNAYAKNGCLITILGNQYWLNDKLIEMHINSQ